MYYFIYLVKWFFLQTLFTIKGSEQHWMWRSTK